YPWQAPRVWRGDREAKPRRTGDARHHKAPGRKRRSATDRTRFVRACAFNFVILGPDAHGKNFSVLIDSAGRYRLAPLYDINSALPCDLEKARKLAMTIGGEGRWRSVAPIHWEKAARLC